MSYPDMLNCTWREFDYYQTGHNRRVERGWDYVRHLISSNYNSSGFSKKKVNAKDIMQLPMLDKKRTIFKKVPKESVERMLKLME